jgi:hypothetical protein
VLLKSVGVPFPESTKERMEPRKQGDGEDLWFDRWALLWGQKPEDWYATKTVPVSQQLAGTFSQDFIDRMQRTITRRRTAGPDGIPENPLYTWQYEFIEKSEEDKAAFEQWLVDQRANVTLTPTYLDLDGETVLTEEQVKEKYLSKDPNWTPPPLPHPKRLLEELKARNAKYWRALYEKRAKQQALQGITKAAETLVAGGGKSKGGAEGDEGRQA